MIHVRRGVPRRHPSPFCAENANNVRRLCWRESVALTVSHPRPLGRREGRKGGRGGGWGGVTLGSVDTVGGRGKEERGGGGWETRTHIREEPARVCVCVVHMRASERVVELGHSRHVSPRLQRRQAKLT